MSAGILGAIGVDVPAGTGDVNVRCIFNPDHHRHGDRNKSLSINRDTGRYKCHGCGAQGGPYDLALHHGYTLADAMQLVDDHGLALPGRNGTGGTSRRVSPAVKPRKPAAPASAPRPLDVTEDDVKEYRAALHGHADVAAKMMERGWTGEAARDLELGVRHDGRITFPLRDDAGQLVGCVYHSLNGAKPKTLCATGTRRVLFPNPATLKGDTVWITEGEADAVTATSIGLPAVGVGGAENWKPEFAQAFKNRDVIVIPDCDDAGAQLRDRITAALRGVALSVKVVDLDGEDGYDLTDAVRDGADPDSLLACAGPAPTPASTPPPEIELDAEPEIELDAEPERPVVITAREFISRPKPPVAPLVQTISGRTVLLGVENTLLAAGPSGHGKSLAVTYQLGGLLASDHGGLWLSMNATGGQRVLVVPFEGSEDDNADRAQQLIPDDAQDRFLFWDRWNGSTLPRAADDDSLDLLALKIAEWEVDVLILDTGSAFFGSGFSVDKGEEADAFLQELRHRSGRRFAVIVVTHTKKMDRAGNVADWLEEISGTFHKKADAAVIIRKQDGGGASPKRFVAFPKVRRGPEPPEIVATFPARDSDDPPLLEYVSGTGGNLKEGSEADRIAEWIRPHDTPQTVKQICDGLGFSDKTLVRRRPELEQDGITHGPLPWGGGNSYGYGTDEQWTCARRLGEQLS